MTDLYVPFFEATRSVFQMMLDYNDVTDRPVQKLSCEEATAICVGVFGDLSGEVVYRFPHETALNIVRTMSGMQIDDMDVFVASAISEIANIISGNVLTLLAASDLSCDITAPRLADCAERAQSGVSCCIGTPAGDVCLDIRLKETQSE